MNIQELAWKFLEGNDHLKLISVNEEKIENYGNIDFYGDEILFEGDLTEEVKVFWVRFAIPESSRYQRIEEENVTNEMNKFVGFSQGDWDGIENCEGEQIYYCRLTLK